MQAMQKALCEHCNALYRYTLWNASFGDFSYCYCDTCGMLATIDYRNPRMALLPYTPLLHQEMDAIWEPHLNPCSCGGAFRRGSSPCCPRCRLPLSAETAGYYIEQNAGAIAKDWKWQRNWSDSYCIAIEEINADGELRLITDPFLTREQPAEKKGWKSFFGFGK
jgi:hypothetical protein